MCFESTYGDHLHSDSDPKLELEMYINNTRWEGQSLYQALQNVHK
jgi:metallo-beta-lactamase family protein